MCRRTWCEFRIKASNAHRTASCSSRGVGRTSICFSKRARFPLSTPLTRAANVSENWKCNVWPKTVVLRNVLGIVAFNPTYFALLNKSGTRNAPRAQLQDCMDYVLSHHTIACRLNCTAPCTHFISRVEEIVFRSARLISAE